MNTNMTIQISLLSFINYLKVHMNDYDKEMIIQKIYKCDPLYLREEQINNMVIDFLNTNPKDFIMENELFFIVFQAKPSFVNDNMIGELSHSLDEKQKEEIIQYFNRTLQ